MSWQVLVLLLGAFVIAGMLSWWQHTNYQRTVNRIAAEENRSGVVLVSGRGKGWLHGAVVLLVIDRRKREVIRALGMRGASVFARFRERPELAGSLRDVGERAGTRMEGKAVDDALSRFGRMKSMV